MDDHTDRRTLLLWQVTACVLAGMVVVFLIQNWETIRECLR